MRNADLLIQFQEQLGIVSEGEIVQDDDYEQTLEVSFDDARRQEDE